MQFRLKTLQKNIWITALVEIDRLRMSAMEDYFNVNGAGMVLDTRQIHGWRFRESCWKCRCSLVAREFRACVQSTEETFAPTSSQYIVNIFLTMALEFDLNLLVLDIKDAFLCVPQKDLVFIEVPTWISKALPNETHPQYWRLERCLPGQRKAALHWNEDFEMTVQELGFIPYDAIPTVFKHCSRRVFPTIHVDDLLATGSEFHCKWFLDELSKKFSLKSSGPHPVGKHAEFQNLEKNIVVITPDGIVTEPCKQQSPK